MNAADEPAQVRERALATIVAGHPEAIVTALGRDSRFLPMPQSLAEGLGIGPSRGTVGRAPLDMVCPEDHLRVLSKWEALVRQGHAEVGARMLTWDSPAQLVAIDLFDRHGVAVLVAWPDASVDSSTALLGPAGRTPRIARVAKDALGKITHVDEATCAMFGWRPDEMVGHPSAEFIHPEDLPLAVDAWLGMLSEPGPGRRVRLRHACTGDGWKWVEIVNQNLLSDEAHNCVLTDIVDISDEMVAWEQVRDRERLLEEMAQALPVGIARLTSDGQVVYANPRLGELVKGHAGPLSDLGAIVASADERDRRALRRALDEVMRRGAERSVMVRFPLTTGIDGNGVANNNGGHHHRARNEAPHVICEVKVQPLGDEGGQRTGAIACFSDVTEAVSLRRALEHRAETDELTGCANRRSVMEFLEHQVNPPVQLGHDAPVAASRGL
ncbi:MAG TPA: PAS domain S-box protein, partial [Acidimicrobiales bacterium]|nr:PAS domain S-box protein [Acidimicrobiales bacterium]